MRQELLFTLRLWRDGPATEDWRASLKNLGTQREQRFRDLRALFAHLEAIAHRDPDEA